MIIFLVKFSALIQRSLGLLKGLQRLLTNKKRKRNKNNVAAERVLKKS